MKLGIEFNFGGNVTENIKQGANSLNALFMSDKFWKFSEGYCLVNGGFTFTEMSVESVFNVLKTRYYYGASPAIHIFMYKSWFFSSVIGYTSLQYRYNIYQSWKYSTRLSVVERAAHLAHELCHVAGFDHSSQTDYKSVPFLFQESIEEYLNSPELHQRYIDVFDGRSVDVDTMNFFKGELSEQNF